MFLRLLALFIFIPVLELYLIVLLGRYIGILYTLVIICSTGFVGLLLAKNQGWETIKKARNSLDRGQLPANEVLEGLIILSGAIFLLTPGLITDSIGLSMLLPGTRNIYKKIIKVRLWQWLTKRRGRTYI